ncbi:MAG: hypothetical protein ACFCBV_06055 [Phycisphaerales bacterium]
MDEQSPDSIEAQLADAIRGWCSSSAYAKGRRDYIGVAVRDYQPSDASFALELRFKSGGRYCCFESGCHVGNLGARWWRRVRAELDRIGFDGPPRLRIRTLEFVIEDGAQWGLRRPDDDRPLRPVSGYRYTIEGTAEPDSGE